MSPDDDLLKLWARVESHLRDALTLVEVEPPTQRMTEEFLDHNELGLAFQTLVGALGDSASSPTPAAHAHLEAAAVEMDLQDDADWRRLNAQTG